MPVRVPQLNKLSISTGGLEKATLPTTRKGDIGMADNSGSSGLLGVIIGVVLVLGLAYFFLGEKVGLRSSPDVNVKVDVPSAAPSVK
jgi:hypothetical protein